jgi:hypothetical protein
VQRAAPPTSLGHRSTCDAERAYGDPVFHHLLSWAMLCAVHRSERCAGQLLIAHLKASRSRVFSRGAGLIGKDTEQLVTHVPTVLAATSRSPARVASPPIPPLQPSWGESSHPRTVFSVSRPHAPCGCVEPRENEKRVLQSVTHLHYSAMLKSARVYN